VSNLRKAAEQAFVVGWIALRLLRAESKYPVLVLIAELDEMCDALRAALAEPDEVEDLRKVNAELREALEQMKPLEVDIAAILHANLDSLYVEDPPAIAKAEEVQT
jgi:hypothetical protein